MKAQELRDILVREGLFSPKDKKEISVEERHGSVARRADKLSQRFIVSYKDSPRYTVKCIPETWSFSPDDILKTISAYSRLTCINVPKLVSHFKTKDGHCFIDEWLPSPLSLDILIERGSVLPHDAFVLMRDLFAEIYANGRKPSPTFFEQEKNLYISSLRSFVREGVWADLILSYLEKVIEKHAGLLKETRSSGDIIDRNILQSNGQWYLVDYEYSHRTLFGFVDAYRNMFYTRWARSYTLAELYPSLKDFPQDVAAMLSIARESMFQADVLSEEAREMTQKHLRYLFWNVVDHAIVPQLDRRTEEMEALAATRHTELEAIRRQLAEVTQQHISASRQLENLNALVRQKEVEIAKLNTQLLSQQSLILSNDRQINSLQQEITQKDHRIKEVERWGNEMAELAHHKESTIVFQQKSIDELSSRERSLSAQLVEKETAYQQKATEFIYIKSTLSYSVGRILTFPFELLFNGVMIVFRVIDKSVGRLLWPAGTKRAMLVDAFINLKQTIATATYLLRMHGIKGFMGGVRQTWRTGVNLGMHRNFQIPIPQTTIPLKPVSLKPLPLPLRIEQTNVGVSVVIPALNEADNLIKLLPALNNQQGFRTIEIIVVDSGSTDDTVELAEEYGANVIKIPPEHFSHSGARNLGAEHATQEYLLFMTADALPISETWLFQMYSFMKKENVAAVSCMEVPRIDADLFTRVQQWHHYKNFLQLADGDKVLSLPQSQDPTTLRKHGQLTDVACLVTSELFKKYKFRYEYGEDLDFGIRIIHDGFKIGLMESTKVIHSHNRPTYYHLKRGYMDKLVLSKIINEPLHASGLEASSLYAEILLTYNVLGLMRPSKLLGTQEFLTIKELRSRIEESIAPSLKVKIMNDVHIESNEFMDSQFRSFLEKIVRKYNANRKQSNVHGTILKGIHQFLEITFDYMERTYDVVDETVVRDFIFLLYKHFANLCGVYIAICNSNTSNGINGSLAELSQELGDKSIMWEKKNN